MLLLMSCSTPAVIYQSNQTNTFNENLLESILSFEKDSIEIYIPEFLRPQMNIILQNKSLLSKQK